MNLSEEFIRIGMSFNRNVYRYAIFISFVCIFLSFAKKVEAVTPEIQLQQVISGLSNPVGLTHAGDNSDRLFITQQTGQIVIFDGTQILPTPFLNISTKVSCCGERGLLSVAFHPDY